MHTLALLVLLAQSTVTVPATGTLWTNVTLPARVNVAQGATTLGTNACPSSTGSANTCMGDGAGKDMTTGDYNSAWGLQSLWRTTTGQQNVGVGSYALRFNLTGGSNVAIGHAALATTTTSNYNTAIGSGALTNAINSQYSTAIGYGAEFYTTYGFSNSSLGQHALFTNTTGSYNVALGQAGLYLNTTGHRNIGIGYNSGAWAPTAMAGSLTSATSNLGIGQYNYRLAFVLDGQATAMGDVYTVTTDSGHREVTLSTIPTYAGALTCTARKIYRSTVGDVNQSTYKLAATLSDCTTPGSYVDTLADASLGAVPVDPSDSIAIGHEAKYTKSGQTVIGSAATVELILRGVPGTGNYMCIDAQDRVYRSPDNCSR